MGARSHSASTDDENRRTSSSQPCGGEWSTPRKHSVGTSAPLLSNFEHEINVPFDSISVSFSSPKVFET